MTWRRHFLLILAVPLLLGAGGDWVLEPETGAMLEARATYIGVPNNCLLVATLARQLLQKQGIPTRVIQIRTTHEWHVYVCTARVCFDNGYLTPGLFLMSSLEKERNPLY